MGRECLFVEGLKMRPTAERVLKALACAEAVPMYHQTGVGIPEIAERSGLSAHVVRARLQDLRRLGLVESAKVWTSTTDRTLRYGHYLTERGVRRAGIAVCEAVGASV